jgi:RNA polymerase sigma factor (sigma-70 family)
MDNLPKFSLVEGIKTRDADTILYVYKTLAPKILGYVMNNNGTKEDGKELFQATYLKAFQNLKAEKYHEEGKFEQWFNQIAKNLWLEELRHRRRTMAQNIDDVPMIADETEGLTQALLKNRYLEALHRAMVRIEEPCRSMLRRFHAEESVSSLELAKELGKNDGAIRVQLKRCREKLRKLLEEELGNDHTEVGI